MKPAVLWLSVLVAGCTGTSTTSTGPGPDATPKVEEACVAVSAFAMPIREGKTPLPIPPDETAVNAAMTLKTVVRDHARDPKNPWAVSHALLAIGPELRLSNGEVAIDYLFSEYAETFEACGETLVRFPRVRGDIRIEPHTDLILKALTEIGVPPEREVTVKGKKFTVGHLYRGSMYRAWVQKDGTVPFGPFEAKASNDLDAWNDTPWALQGLAAWAADDLSWTARGDHKMDMDVFTSAAVSRIDAETQALQIQQKGGQSFDKIAAAKAGGLVTMTCGGAHMLQGTGYALARGFGNDADKTVYSNQMDLLFWRYQDELDVYTKMLETQPTYRTLIMMQRLKFLGHFVETTHKWVILGLLQPTPEQELIMKDATVQLVATVAVLAQTGILANLGKLTDPKIPQVYPGVITNEQLYLDYVGDSAHGYRGLDLALGHGVLRY
ncbi:MAG: hypothetical protein AB8H79_15840 [Myxococcota bacterium]